MRSLPEPSLQEQQRAFAAALFDGATDCLAALVRGDGIDPHDRLGLYRHTVQENFRHALAVGFPVMLRLVGEDYFRGLAIDYQAAAPSRSGDLHHAGAGFAEFLRARHAATRYAYFADVAALEWAHGEVLIAADPPPLARVLERLAAWPEDRHAELHFRALPSARLLHSEFPVLRIWLANQDPPTDETKDEVIDLSAGTERLLVCRGPDGGVEFHRLDAASFAFAAALVAGRSLGEADEAALESGCSYNVATELRRLLVHGVLDTPARDP
jgi:hypothetical protein